MLTFLGAPRRYCDGLRRRDFLKVGGLALGSLTLADVLRQRSLAAPGTAKNRAVIMIYLPGGPSHLDMYDLKPEAPAEFRGEFRPIRSNVPGIQLCELMPRQAKIMDKLSILRGISFVDEHSAHLVMTGFPDRVKRPCFGSLVSHLKPRQGGLPLYVSLMNNMKDEDPAYLGTSHRPFVPSGPGLENLGLVSEVNISRLGNRKRLLKHLDTLRGDIDNSGGLAGVDAFTTRALDMITSPEARAAFDVEKEPRTVRERYGEQNRDFLRARRLVEAGVSVVTLATGGWDTHGDNFNQLRRMLPHLDQGIHALVTDLHERGLAQDVSVVMWGEFGRTPRINGGAGRDHWAPAGFALLAGGRFKHGQAVGETDAHGERSLNKPMTPSNVLSTLYHHLEIDPAITVRDNFGRPMYLLDEREPVRDLL